jgi:peptidoglycan hydrolase CwlO-like protein
MNYISELITGAIGLFAGVAGAIVSLRSSKIDNTAKLIELWEKANHNCQSELDEVRAEIKQMREEHQQQRQERDDEISKLQQKVKVLEGHIKKLEKA